MKNQQIPVARLLANFMSAAVPLEDYLRQGKPFTRIQLEAITSTLSGLQTFLDVWKRKTNLPLNQPASVSPSDRHH